MQRLKAHLWRGGRQTAKKMMEISWSFFSGKEDVGTHEHFLHALTCIVQQHVATVFMFYHSYSSILCLGGRRVD